MQGLENYTDDNNQESGFLNGDENKQILASGYNRQFVHDLEHDYFYTQVPNGVAVLLKYGDDYIFTKQFRPSVGKTSIELIYGGVHDSDKDNNMLSAIRSVIEEVGCHIKGIKKLGNFFASPSVLSEEFTIFIAEVEVAEGEDETEFLNKVDSVDSMTFDFEADNTDKALVKLSRNNVLEHIRDGKFLLSSLALAVLFDILVSRGKG